MDKKIEIFFAGMDLKKIAEERRKYIESLKDLPFKIDTIPISELKALHSIKEFLDEKMNTLAKENTNWHETISEILRDMDRRDIWSYKFSTESQGDWRENRKETPSDSIYYMTPSGVSLRFKMANRNQGLMGVVQPIMEKIFFERGDALSETPNLGYNVQEYATQEFLDQLKKDPVGDYESSIKKYYRDGKTEIPKLQNIKITHNGSLVNKIYFKKNGTIQET